LKKMLLNIVVIPFLALVCQSQDSTCDFYFNNEVDDYVYTKMTNKPAFVGGDEKLLEYLVENLSYPEGEIQSTVILKLLFDEEGNIINAKINDKHNQNFTPVELAVVKVFLTLPRWNPGICASIKVKSEIIYPLRINSG